MNTDEIKTESIYIHIPFCKTKCPYCDFASWAKKEDLIDEYFTALIHEINSKCNAYISYKKDKSSKILAKIKTIFIGGGTPSLISSLHYKKLFDELKTFFEISNDCEITLELNPGTARKDFLQGYKDIGINRISIGAQSFNEQILNTLGRKHSIDETLDAINLVKETGFENFSLDLIFSVPGITKDIWADTLLEAVKHKPKHISAYSLIIEPNTPFELIYKNPALLPPDDFAWDLYSQLCSTLKKEGFNQYEISNFARSGFESKHNLNYWLNKEYYAFGVSAHRFINGLRTNNTKELNGYIKNPSLEHIIDFPTNFDFEKVMLNSRLNSGFDLSDLYKISTKNVNEITGILKELSHKDFLELSNEKIHLTEKGMFVNTEILLKLI